MSKVSTLSPIGSAHATSAIAHPVRGRINALFFRVADGYAHWKYGERKQRLFADLPDTVVELGAGTGANFRYFRPGTRVIAIEPNLHMHGFLREQARRYQIDLTIQVRGAEDIDLADESVGAVLSTLVLCTVPDPVATLREVKRILRPGGRFLCIEHVAAHPHSWIGRVQRWLHRPWSYFFEGCHTHRDTGLTLSQANFSQLRMDRFELPTMFIPIRPQIAAIATK